MTADFQFGSSDNRPPDQPVTPPSEDGMPSMPSQPEIPPVPPVTPYQGQTYTPPAPVNPQQPAGGNYPPAYGAQPGYSYTQPNAHTQQPYSYYQPQQQGYAAPYYPPPAVQSAPGNGFAVASLILGIVALITSCSLVLSIPCGIIGLILGIVGKAKGAGGMAVAGIVLSVLALLFTIFFIVCIVVADGAYFWIGSPYTMSMFAR